MNYLAFVVPRTGTNPKNQRKTKEFNSPIYQRISVWGIFSLWYKIAYVMQKVYTLFIPE